MTKPILAEVILAIAANPFLSLAPTFELTSPLHPLRQLLALENLISFQSFLHFHIDPNKPSTLAPGGFALRNENWTTPKRNPSRPFHG